MSYHGMGASADEIATVVRASSEGAAQIIGAFKKKKRRRRSAETPTMTAQTDVSTPTPAWILPVALMGGGLILVTAVTLVMRRKS